MIELQRLRPEGRQVSRCSNFLRVVSMTVALGVVAGSAAAQEPDSTAVRRSPAGGVGGPKEMARELEVDNTPRERAYRIPIRVMDGWYDWKADLTERTGLQFNINYNAAYTQASATIEEGAPDWAASGVLELSAGWTLFGRESGNKGTLFAKGVSRHSIGSDRTPMFLGFSTGYYGLPATAFREYSFRMVELNWAQQLFDQRLAFVLGKIDLTNYFNFHGLIVPWRHFLGYGSSVSGTVNWGNPGWGGVVSVRPTEQFFVMGGIADAEGDPFLDGEFLTGGDHFFDGRLMKMIEVGWVPTFAERYFKKISVMYWDADEFEAYDGSTSAAGNGWAASAHWFFNDTWAPYLRVASGSGGGFNTFYDTQVQAGVGRVARNYDMLGISASWSDTNIPDSEDQYTGEVFWRFVLTQHFEVTPSLQLIGNPTLNPGQDWMTYLSLRTRLTF
jgi:porin